MGTFFDIVKRVGNMICLMPTTGGYRWPYNSSNYADLKVNSDGELQITTVGTDPDIRLEPGSGSNNLIVTAANMTITDAGLIAFAPTVGADYGLQISANMGGNNVPLTKVVGTPTSATAASRGGVIYIEMNRGTVMTSWDGNPDTMLKMRGENNANNTAARGGIRGIDCMVRNDDASAICANVHTAYLTAENTSDINTTCNDMQVLQLIMSNQGVVNTLLYGLRVLENSEGTIPADTVGIKVTTSTNAPAAGTRADAIMITTGGAVGGWTDGLHIAGTITNGINIAGPNVAIVTTKTLSSQTAETAYVDITFATDSTFLTGTLINYSGGRGSSAIKITGTHSAVTGGYHAILATVAANNNYTTDGHGVIVVKGVVTSTNVAVTRGDIYGAQFIAKKAGTGVATAEVAWIGSESWFYETDSGEIRTGIGGNFGWHADSTAGSHAVGSVWRGVQIFCDSAGTTKAEETTGLYIWSMSGTLDTGIVIGAGTITTGISFIGTLTNAMRFNDDQAIAWDNENTGTAAGAIKVLVGAATRYIQLYSGSPA